jgi:hypothetical protein
MCAYIDFPLIVKFLAEPQIGSEISAASKGTSSVETKN